MLIDCVRLALVDEGLQVDELVDFRSRIEGVLEWPAIATQLKKSGISTQIITNGLSLTPDTIGKMQNAGIDALGVSLDGGEATHNRAALPRLERIAPLRRVDDIPVWSISCFYIRKGYRRRGVTSALIEGAIAAAKKAGAPALEAYPLDAELTQSTSFTGYSSTFLRAGFKVVARCVASDHAN